MNVLGLDIGGANIKLATTRGFANQRPFALWREPARLGALLAELINAAPAHDRIAATTTGELADCFVTKREGVRHIYDALAEAAGETPVEVYLTDGRFVSIPEAIERPELAAASNWHALARFASRAATFDSEAPRDHAVSLLIDIGSTTTDLIPLVGREPSSSGGTDTERLVAGELVYTGVVRTPVASLVTELPWRGGHCPIARELFATALDAHLWLGNLPEDPLDLETADGRPATRVAARDRLARMIGADRDTFDDSAARAAAAHVALAQEALIAASLSRVVERFSAEPRTYLLSGQGEFLAHRALDRLQLVGARISLSDCLGPLISQAGPAAAVAALAEERRHAMTWTVENEGACR